MKAHSRRTATPLLVVLAVFLIVDPGALFAQDSLSSNVVAGWLSRAAGARQELLDGRYKAGRKELDKILKEVLEQVTHGPATTPLLTHLTLLRALAQAGLENGYHAAWDLAMVRTMQPATVQLDLSEYGELGEALLSEEAIWSSFPASTIHTGGGGAVAAEEVVPPKKLEADPPKYPRAKRTSGVQALVIVEVVIAPDGTTRRPVVISRKTDPILAFVAMDKLRSWRFEPARRNGRPIPAYYELTINFHLR